ncbi:MAG: DUF433 domain-containing protein [Chloroflexota bacterium]|nr:DUF433 domain-containing protein [Chloroflexota bacterium]
MTSRLAEIESLLPDLSAAEKVQLVYKIVRDISQPDAGIERTPDVCGGAARIAGTRIPVWSLVQFRNLGASEVEILTHYPSLRAEDLVNAWSYAATHYDEIAADIARNEMD